MLTLLGMWALDMGPDAIEELTGTAQPQMRPRFLTSLGKSDPAQSISSQHCIIGGREIVKPADGCVQLFARHHL